MSEAVFYPYRAFISYSHADSTHCEKLHRTLEAYVVDRELVGRITPAGPVPERLAPIFRDRSDFSTGALEEQTKAALAQSQFLIVLASPNAARSAYVNEEIRHFKAAGGAKRICVLIVEGTPPGCFPPALRYRVTANGMITGETEDTLAGDIAKDGAREAFVKIVAGLLGLPYDYLWMRDVKAQKRRAIVRNGLAAALAVSLAGAGVFAWEHFVTKREVAQLQDSGAKQGERIANVEAIVQKLLAVQSAQAAPGQREEVRSAVQSIASGAEQGDARLKQALALLKDGKISEAEPLLQALAADKEKSIAQQQARIAEDRRQAAAAWRNLGAIAGLRDPKKAREAYAKGVELEPENADALAWDGWFQLRAGNLTRAEASYLALTRLAGADANQRFWAQIGLGEIAVARGDLPGALARSEQALADMRSLAQADQNGLWLRNSSVGFNRVGDVYVAMGDTAKALEANQSSLAIDERRAAIEPANAQAQRDLSIALDRIASLRARQGGLSEALEFYQRSLAIRQRLSSSDPDNSEWQRDLSVSYAAIGDVRIELGDRIGALENYQSGRAIRQRLVDTDPSNAQMQRDLSFMDGKIGDVRSSQGDSAGALDAFRSALAIRQRLSEADPANAGWRRDLCVNNERIGDIHFSQGKHAEALSAYRNSLSICQPLTEMDPANAEWRRSLVVAHGKIGEIEAAMGDLPAALQSHQNGVAIAEELAAKDRSNSRRQHDLSVSYNKLADIYFAQNKLDEALAFYRKSLAISESLAGLNSLNKIWQRSLSSTHAKIADVLVAQGKPAEALERYRDSLAIRERLANSDPGNTDWQRDLAVIRSQIGVVLDKQGDRTGAIEMHRSALEIRERLAKSDPGNARWQRDLIVSYFNLSRVLPQEARSYLTKALEIATRLRDEGRLAPRDSWMIDSFTKRIAALDAPPEKQ